MSEEPEVSKETPETAAEVVTDEELDDVAGGLTKSAVKSPIKDDDAFVSFPPDFLKVMSYRETDATFAGSAGRSVSEIFDKLAQDGVVDE